MSSDPNRPRPRSSKKRRAVQSGSAAAGSSRPNQPGGPATLRARAGATRGGSATSGIPPAGWAIGAIALFVIGVALAGGVIKFGSGSDASARPSAVITGKASSAPPGPRGTNCPTAQPPAAPAGESRVVTISTAKGKIQITLRADLSPIAVGNFEALVACGFYDGIVFHRAAALQDGTPFVIQGGDPDGNGGGGPGYTIQDEPVTTAYVRGTVAMARSTQPNSVGSQFFIVLDDKDQAVLASANTYQIIGSVTDGMATADAIFAAAGGQELPANPIAMDTVTIGPASSGSPAPAGSGPAGSAPAASAPAATSSASPS